MKKIIYRYLVGACLLFALSLPGSAAWAELDPFVGEMIWVPYNFEPMGWAFCDGRLLQISQNTALFSLLGTTYVGNGQTTFALPDMRGRVMIHSGQGPGLSSYVQGESSGEATHTPLQNEMPAHSHGFQSSTTTGSSTTPAGSLFGQSASAKQYGQGPNTSMKANVLGVTSGGQPHNNMMPYATLNCIIALQGIYPARP